MIKGIDVSKHQGEIDWKKVRNAGNEFALIRMALTNYIGGIWKIDPFFRANYRGAKEAGLKVGVYVFSYDLTPEAAIKTGEEIADYILKNDIELDFPVAYDLEEFRTRREALANAGIDEEDFKPGEHFFYFASNLKEKGLSTMLYTCPAYIYEHMDADIDFISAGYPIWIADYRTPFDKKPSKYSGAYEIWQYRGDTGRCPGVEGPCDLDYLREDSPLYTWRKTEETDWKKKYFDLIAKIEELIRKEGGEA